MNFKTILIFSMFVPIYFAGCGTKNAGLITANVVAPSDLSSISRFRSCCGHDYSGKGESNRSMKNYFNAKASYGNSKESVKVFAPFDGEVAGVNAEEHKLPCYNNDFQGFQIEIVPRLRPDMKVKIFHTNPIVSKGKKVSAGDHIGYADLRNCDGSGGTPSGQGSFDVSLEGGLGGKLSYFDFIDDSSLDQWLSRGLPSRSSATISKEARDNSPCMAFASTQCSAETINLF